MDKYIYDESNCLWYELPDTSRRRTQAYRHLGTAAQKVFERTQEIHLHHNTDDGKTEQLFC